MMESRLDEPNELHISDHLEDDDDEGFFSTGENSGLPIFNLFEIELEEKLKDNCKTLIICDGKQAAEFGTNNLKLENVIGKLWKSSKSDQQLTSDIEFWGLRDKKPEPSTFYQVKESVLLFIPSSSLLPEDVHMFSTTVIKCFRHLTTVVILTVSSLSNYKTEIYANEFETPLVRLLSTSNFCTTSKFAELEKPNILGGVTAGTLTECEISEIPAAAFIIFSSSLNLETWMPDKFAAFLHSCEVTNMLNISKGGRLPPTDNASLKTGNLYS